jgi:hypothetical protein
MCHHSLVPDTRSRRGAHPKDRRCFLPQAIPRIRAAVDDLSWLLTRGYPPKAALKLVGDRHALRDRQRKALQRCAAGDEECRSRREREVEVDALRDEAVAVDGYNVLLTLETALSGGVVLLARDGSLRDLAAMSSHYRRVETTRPAIELLHRFFRGAGCRRIAWYLDRPVSNSGRLKKLIESVVAAQHPPWEVALTTRTDQVLIDSPYIVATADSVILDRCGRWLNLARRVVEESIPEAWIVNLAQGRQRVS